MPDILLIQPPFEDFYRTPLRTYPLGLLYIAGALRDRGLTVAVLDALDATDARTVRLPAGLDYCRVIYPTDRSPFHLFGRYTCFGLSIDRVVAAAAACHPAAVFVSLLCTAYSATGLALAQALREALPGVPLVCGGHHAARFPETCLPIFDYVVCGEGETAAAELACRLVRGAQGIDGIPGVYTGVPIEPVFITPEDVEQLQPARDLVPVPEHRGRRFTPILTSRGCPCACSYCCTGRGMSGGWRPRSVRAVLDEFRECHDRLGITFFDVEDENFAADRERAAAICDGLAGRFDRTLKLAAMNGLLPETLDADLIGRMHAAGFEELNLSLGATTERVLKAYRRPPRLMEPFGRAVTAARELQMTVTAYTIAGGPHAAAEDTAADLATLGRMPVRIGLSTYYPAPGSPDYEAGLIPVPAVFDGYRSSVYPVEAVMDRNALVTASRLARVINYVKALPGRGITVLRDTQPVRVGETVGRDDEPRLAATVFREGWIPGLDAGRQVYRHTADEDLIRAVVQGIGTAVRGCDGEVSVRT